MTPLNNPINPTYLVSLFNNKREVEELEHGSAMLFNMPAVYCVFKYVRVVGSRFSVVRLVGIMFLLCFIFPRLLLRFLFCLVYEKCYINEVALPCLALMSLTFHMGYLRVQFLVLCSISTCFHFSLSVSNLTSLIICWSYPIIHFYLRWWSQPLFNVLMVLQLGWLKTSWS